MESIEQLHKDTWPLISLGTASAAIGESLGSLLSRLADKSTPLLIQRPPHARIYYVAQLDSASLETAWPHTGRIEREITYCQARTGHTYLLMVNDACAVLRYVIMRDDEFGFEESAMHNKRVTLSSLADY